MSLQAIGGMQDIPEHLRGRQLIIVDQAGGGVMMHRPIGNETPMNLINRTKITDDMIPLLVDVHVERALMSMVVPGVKMTRAEIIAALLKRFPGDDALSKAA